MGNKRILEIINLPSSAINFIGGQFKYLNEEGGYEMHLICSPGGGIEKFCVDNGVQYYPVKLERQVSIISDLKALFQICSYIKNNKIDIVIAHQAKGRLLGMLGSTIMRVPHRIIFAHGILYETMTGLKRRLLMKNDKFVSLMSHRVVCVSNYVSSCRLKDKIDKPEKQVILGMGSCNGLDTIDKFNPALVLKDDIEALGVKYGIESNDFVIGFCGRLVRDKGIIELVKAFKVITEKHPELHIKLLIIGNPENRDALPRDVINYLTSAKNVVFTGGVPYEDIQKYYMLMNVLVLPSHREGFGMVAVEASAMEIPVLVSDYTGCLETIIPNQTGLYINQNPETIVAAIEQCFDKNYAKFLGRNGRIFVTEHFEHTIIRKDVLKMINSL